MGRRVHIKIQSVEHHHLDLSFEGRLSIGQEVDRLLIDMDTNKNRRFPNKLVIDLNPPEELDANQMDK